MAKTNIEYILAVIIITIIIIILHLCSTMKKESIKSQ